MHFEKGMIPLKSNLQFVVLFSVSLFHEVRDCFPELYELRTTKIVVSYDYRVTIAATTNIHNRGFFILSIVSICMSC
jgi:uncharacterized protein YutD